MQRRAFLALSAAASLPFGGNALARTPDSDEFEQYDLRLEHAPAMSRRTLVLIPRHVDNGNKLNLLVLLHGLGEMGDELRGIHAWGELYGLVRCYERLRHPPVAPTLPRRRYLSEQRASEINHALAERPFTGFAIACPVTPNPYKLAPAKRSLDSYADFIERTLIPAVRARVTLSGHTLSERGVGLGGCSLGGYVGIELFLRKPELFVTFAGVQSAFSVAAALRYALEVADAVRRVGKRPILLESSSLDPYRESNVALSKKLAELGVTNDLVVPKGPHDQPWLREIGTLEMLLWQDRAFASAELEQPMQASSTKFGREGAR